MLRKVTHSAKLIYFMFLNYRANLTIFLLVFREGVSKISYSIRTERPINNSNHKKYGTEAVSKHFCVLISVLKLSEKATCYFTKIK